MLACENRDPTKFPGYITSLQIQAARNLPQWKQGDLASAAGLSLLNVGHVERGSFGSQRYIAPVLRALVNTGIEFVSDRHTTLWVSCSILNPVL